MRSHVETGAVLRVGVLVVLGLLARSTALSAQTLPLPALPAEPAPAEPADSNEPTEVGLEALGAAAPERPRAWEYGLSLGAGWSSNIDFLRPDGPSGLAISPRGNLARVFWSPKGQLRVAGAGNWVGYPSREKLSTYDFTFILDGNYRSSPNTTWRVNGSYGLGYSDSSVVLAAQGVLLPLVKTRTLAATLGVTRKLGSKTSFHLDGRVYSTAFDQAFAVAPALANGQSIRGSAGFERTLGQRDTATLEYALEGALGGTPPEAADQKGSYYLTQYASLRWTRLLSSRSGLLLEAGLSYTPNTEEAGLGQPTSFYGGASYSREVKRSKLTLFARREVTPAFGLGVSRLENRLGLTATIPVAWEWTLRLAALHVNPTTPPGAEFAYSTPDQALFSLGRRIARALEVSTEARYRRRGGTSVLPAIEAFEAGVFLSLLSPSSRVRAPPFVR